MKKDVKSFLLLLLSVGLTATWIYHLYDKSRYTQLQTKEIIVKDTSGIATAIKDSLERYYASLIPDPIIIDTLSKADADSLRVQLSSRLAEIARLRKTLSKGNLTKEELQSAKEKIMELRNEIDQMKTQQVSLEDERKRLSTELDNLSLDMKGMEKSIGRLDAENKELKEIVNNASVLSSKDVRLSVVDTKSSGTSEVETSKVKRADKFVVSFMVQNSIAQFNSAEVIVVITAPDGQIVTNTVWDSGVFDSKKEGRKVYTRKLKFEYARNEEKRLIFTLDYADFIKGVYKMQLYHNGIQIGEASKELN